MIPRHLGETVLDVDPDLVGQWVGEVVNRYLDQVDIFPIFYEINVFDLFFRATHGQPYGQREKRHIIECLASSIDWVRKCCGDAAVDKLTAAYVDSVPMLVITGMNALDSWGRHDFQESSPYAGVDTTSIFGPVCKRSEVVVSEKTIQFRLRNAIATALSGRPGPVHLAIPRDLWNKQISPELWDRVLYLPSPPAPLMKDVLTTARLLADAERPLILYGSGASPKAASYLAEISERMNIPLLTTPRAKGKGVANVPSRRGEGWRDHPVAGPEIQPSGS